MMKKTIVCLLVLSFAHIQTYTLGVDAFLVLSPSIVGASYCGYKCVCSIQETCEQPSLRSATRIIAWGIGTPIALFGPATMYSAGPWFLAYGIRKWQLRNHR